VPRSRRCQGSGGAGYCHRARGRVIIVVLWG
jgi:hypothetical protein